MGHVWKARQLSLDRIVAIKLLPPRFSHDVESVRQIIQEARTAAKLKHPGIVQVYDANEQNGSFFFVMEYVDGYTVGQWVRRKQLLQPKDALIVVESVANALNYAWHTSELIHCDLKLENVMVDNDGTIKVADLGLSLTRDSKSSLQDDEVAGTPGYIAPEQVIGTAVLDCRADIYSLGCCLYHMVTGMRPFHELSDSDAMEAQISSFIPDPRDVVSSIPGPVCALIERMLVKNRESRLKDWQSVLSEVHRVQKGLAPSGPPLEENASTMRRRPGMPPPVKDAGSIKEENASMGQAAGMIFGVVVLAMLVGGYWMLRKSPKVNDVSIPTSFLQHTNVIGVQGETQAPPSAVHVVKSPDAKADEIAEALEEINRVTNGYVEEGNFDEAIRWLEHYYGRCTSETASNRVALAAGLRQKLVQKDGLKQAEAEWQSLIKEVTSCVLTAKFSSARQLLATTDKSGKLSSHHSELSAMTEVLEKVVSLNDRILETFAKDVGKVIPLERGALEGRMVEIRDRKIVCSMEGEARINVRLEDIAVAERSRRLAMLDLPEAYLVRGVAALNEGKTDEALSLLAKTGPVFGPLLTRIMEQELKAMHDAAVPVVVPADDAMTAFLGIMKEAGLAPGPYDSQQWRAAIDSCHLDRESVEVVNRSLESFLTTYGRSPFAEKNAELILGLQRACGNAVDLIPDAPVAVVSPESSAMAKIAAAMMARNPGLEQSAFQLDERVKGRDNFGLLIVSSFLRDLSPLADFKDITSLTLESSGPRGGSLDIAPLVALGLKQFSIQGYDITDPSKLRGMKLSRLAIPDVSLKSLTILFGMPLKELDIRGTPVSDLSALQGMKLEVLRANNTKVASIMSLSGMPIHCLTLGGTLIRDVAYLHGLPLESLDLSATPVVDFSVLRSFKLNTLDISKTTVRDLAFCSELPLTNLDISGTSLPSLSPLGGKTFSRLVLGNASIRDISGLKAIKVTALDLSGTKLSPMALAAAFAQSRVEEVNLSNAELDQIEFLRSCTALKTLNLSHTKVSDLSPIAGLPIEELNLKGVAEVDLASLGTLHSLRSLDADIDSYRLLRLLETAPRLTRINGVPVKSMLVKMRQMLRMPGRVAE